MNPNAQRWQQAILPLDSTIEQTIRNLDQVAIKIVLVVDTSGALAGTVSDGDIRRGLLRGLGMASLITEVMNRNAMVVPSQMSRELVRQLMVANKIQSASVGRDRRAGRAGQPHGHHGRGHGQAAAAIYRKLSQATAARSGKAHA